MDKTAKPPALLKLHVDLTFEIVIPFVSELSGTNGICFNKCELALRMRIPLGASLKGLFILVVVVVAVGISAACFGRRIHHAAANELAFSQSFSNSTGLR